MNYLAHGYDHLERPYFVAGTAVPDWLNVANRKSRAREKRARLWIEDSDQAVAEIAKGIVQHHHDDAWFHQTRAFVELSMEFSVQIRELLRACAANAPEGSVNPERGFRAGFLGHILVELLLDASLIEDQPKKLEQYYAAVESVDPSAVGSVVNKIATEPVPLLPSLIPRFCQERFLGDYLDDGRLLWRLNHVMKRVKLAALPDEFAEFFPAARRRVREHQAELLNRS